MIIRNTFVRPGGGPHWRYLGFIVALVAACALLTLQPLWVVSYPAAWALLVLLPGMQLTRWLGLYADWREGRTLILSAAAGLVTVPAWLHWMGLAFGFTRWVVLGAVVGLNLVLVGLNVAFPAAARQKAALVETRRQGIVFAAMLLILAVAVIVPYVEWHTEVGVYPVEMGDWFKHYGVAWSIRHTGVPPVDVFFYGDPNRDRLSYYYFYHLIVAALDILHSGTSDIYAASVTMVLSISLIFALLAYVLARCLFERASVALWSLFCVIFVGGLDVIPMIPRNYEALARTMPEALNSWLVYFPIDHVDNWAPAPYLRLNTLYATYIWVPQHVAGLLLFLLGLYWLREVSARRRLVFAAPFLLLSLLGHSVWIAIAVIACLGIYAALQIAHAWHEEGKDVVKRLGLAFLVVVLLFGVISVPLIREYLSPAAPRSGIVFEIPLTREWTWLSPFKSSFSHTWVTRLLDILLHYVWELGALLGGLVGLWWFSKRQRGEALRVWFWLVLGVGFVAVTFFASGRTWKSQGFLMNNDLGLRAIMPAQVVLALFTGYLVAHWRAVRMPRSLKVLAMGIFGIMIGLGVLAFGWEVCAMGVAKYFKPPRIDAATYRAFQAMKSVTESHSIVRHLFYDDNAAQYQLMFSDRSPGVWLGEALVLYSNADYLIYQLGLRKMVLANRLPLWSYQALRELRADYLYVGDRERKSISHIAKFDNPTYYEKVYEEYPIAIYRVRKLPLERMQARFVPSGIRYMGYIIDEAPVYPLGFQHATPKALVTAWWLEQPVQQDFTVYVHFLNSAGEVVAQADHQLWSWVDRTEVPTSGWYPGHLYLDIFPLPESVLNAQEALHIGIGLWLPSTGEHQQVETNELSLDSAQRLVIGQIEPSHSP